MNNSIKLFLLAIVSLNSFSVVEGKSRRLSFPSIAPYTTGTLKNLEGKTAVAFAAENCDCKKKDLEDFLSQVSIVYGTKELMREAVAALLFQKDNQGKNPADLAHERFLQTGNKHCIEMKIKMIEALLQIPEQLRTEDQKKAIAKYVNRQ